MKSVTSFLSRELRGISFRSLFSDLITILVVAGSMAFSSMALAQVVNNQIGYVGNADGEWGGSKTAALGPVDGSCANMGAVGKTNLVSNFGFDLPSDATVTHFGAYVFTNSQAPQVFTVQLASDASGLPHTPIGGPLEITTAGGGAACKDAVSNFVAGDLATWGLGSVDYSTVNASAFGMVLLTDESSSLKIDSICLNVTYTTPDGEAMVEDCFAPAISSITVTKVVENGTTGGTLVATDFDVQIDGSSVISGAANILDPGEYTVGEVDVAGYTGVISGDCDPTTGVVTLAEGEALSCTITNTAQQATLTVTKVVDNGISAVVMTASDFDIQINAGSVTSGVSYNVEPGVHTIGEVNVASYTGVISGDCDPTTGEVTLALGESKSCTITNTYVAPPPEIEVVPVPTSNAWVLVLLTLMLLATGWYFRPARMR